MFSKYMGYSFNHFLRSLLLSVSLFFFPQILTAQIVNQEGQELEEKKEEKVKKEKKTIENDSLGNSILYVSGVGIYGYRSFEDQSVYNSFAKWEDQTPLMTGGVSIGTIMPLDPHFSLDISFTFFGHGESYDYEDELTDSSFHYTNRYKQMGIPLKLRYTVGKTLQFYGFMGVAPLQVLSNRYDYSYSNSSGTGFDGQPSVDKSQVVSFAFMGMAGVGCNYQLNRWGFFLSPEFRYHFSNTYGSGTYPIQHNMWGVGVNAGIALTF